MTHVNRCWNQSKKKNESEIQNVLTIFFFKLTQRWWNVQEGKNAQMGGGSTSIVLALRKILLVMGNGGVPTNAESCQSFASARKRRFRRPK